jgi:two-component system response regulator YesN
MVSQRPDLPYSVVDIAAAARITPNHFSMLFRNYKGQSFLEFVTQVRIEKAKELLGNLTLNINEVAARVGYTDPGYFTRRFRQVTGMSPRKWREQLTS